MADSTWMLNRLKAMSIPEIIWRISQKIIQKGEKRKFKTHKSSVIIEIFNKKILNLKIAPPKLYLNLNNLKYSSSNNIPLLGGYSYKEYKKQWNAGFQTSNTWPVIFSYNLEYKQQDNIGDARTNWELNRHFQFSILAKNYYVTKEKKYLEEFEELFYDWNEVNPFLWGISWTSVMEIAIRCSNWCYAYCFLVETDASKLLLENLETGILNMTDYIVKHYSRYSSANNHLIVEAYTIGQVGILCNYKKWIELAINILTKELPRQNYSDGINKELSLHYQAFYMEATGLMMRLMVKNNIPVPDSWFLMLDKMCRYISDCTGIYGETIEFGDNDEGKILNLQGEFNYCQYILSLYSCLLNWRFIDIEKYNFENINWLFTEFDTEKAKRKPLYKAPQDICYEKGGNSIFRSINRRVLIGIDHAALGFGSIAAHGHADALSFQMFVDGHPIFVDPGTYIYHCDLRSRNTYRKTENHNTMCLDGKNQSEMLGAFLWGKRAECKIIDFQSKPDNIFLHVQHNGYSPLLSNRTFIYDRGCSLTIIDEVMSDKKKEINFIFAPDTKISVCEENVRFVMENVAGNMCFECNADFQIRITEKLYSEKYGEQQNTRGIAVSTIGTLLKSRIKLENM